LAFIHCIDHRPNYNGEPDTFGAAAGFCTELGAMASLLPGRPGRARRYGFWIHAGDDTPGWRFQDNFRIVEVPAWSLIVVTAFLPRDRLRRWRRRRRRQPDCAAPVATTCARTPQRCPECGTPVNAEAA
jgi:hypothetical protein